MKGDRIQIIVVAGGQAIPVSIEAMKAGRTVRRFTRNSKTQGAWVDLKEMSRPSKRNPNGLPTGNEVSVRMEAVASILESRLEPEQARRPKRTPAAKGQTELELA